MRRTRTALAGATIIAASAVAISLGEANTAPVDQACVEAAVTGDPDTLAACLCALRQPLPIADRKVERDRCLPTVPSLHY